jgi:hypothetical protein
MTATMTAPTVDRHGAEWITYQCTGCGRVEIQRADVLAVTCHRIGEHPRPRPHRMRPTREAQR